MRVERYSKLDELLQNGHLSGFLSHNCHCDLVVRVAGDGALREQLYDLGVRHSLIVLRVNTLEQLLDLRLHVLVKAEEAAFTHTVHIGDQEFELMLIEDAYSFLVHLLELVSELTKEVLMLQELVLED